MGIFKILFRNSGHKARTLLPTDQTIPQGFRGVLEHQVERCIGCNTCAHVCSPGAITLETQPEGVVVWQYNALRCTFCARCAEYCPTHAIQMSATAPAAALALHGPSPESSGLLTRHMIKLEFCARCGQPFAAIPGPILEQLMEREIEPEMGYLMRLCEKCRSRETAQRFKDSLAGNLRVKGS